MIAQVTVSTEVALGMIVAAGSVLAGAIGIIYKQLMASHEARIKAIEIERDNWKQLGSEAVKVTRVATNRVLSLQGKPETVEIAPVVGEHQSPMTEKQESVAELATARASLVADTLMLGLEPRTATLVDKAAEVAVKAAEVAVEVFEDAKQKGDDDVDT